MDDNHHHEGRSMTDETKVKKPLGLGKGMEFLMFAFFLAKTLSDTVIVNLLEKSTCLVVLKYNETMCTEPVSPTLQGQLQQSTANLVLARTMIEAFVPSLLSLFIGPWSDTNGRRPLILLSLAGYCISTSMWCILTLIPALHPNYFLLPSIPVALTGGYCTFFLALYCYISDTTEFDQRAFRMGSLEAACLGGVMFSTLSTPYLLKTSSQYGFTIVFASGAVLLSLIFLCVSLFVPESVTIVQSERTKLWRLDHVKEIFTTCFRNRPNHTRTIVMLIIINMVISIILLDGELSVLYMFTQKRFNWSLEEYTRFVSEFILVAGISAVVSTWFFSSLLKLADLPLMFAGCLAMAGKSFVQAIATRGYYFYIGSAFNILSILTTPLSRSQLSKLIPSDDIGKIFAFSAFLESTAPLTAAPAYTFVYKATLDTRPNTIFWLSFGFCCVSCVLVGVALVLQRLSPPPPLDVRPLLVDNDNGGTSVQA